MRTLAGWTFRVMLMSSGNKVREHDHHQGEGRTCNRADAPAGWLRQSIVQTDSASEIPQREANARSDCALALAIMMVQAPLVARLLRPELRSSISCPRPQAARGQ